MIFRMTKMVSLVVFALVLMTSCAGTRLTRSEVDDAFDGQPFSDILVIGIAEKDKTRRLFEKRFVAQLQAAGLEAVASVEAIPMPADLEIEKAAVLEAVRRFGNDAVIITHVAGVTREESIVRHGGSGGDLFNYYGTRYREFQDAGYSISSTKVRLKINLYDVKTEKRVWTGESMTWRRESAREVIDDVIKVVIADLQKHRLIAPK